VQRLVRALYDRDRMEDLDIDGRIILEWALKKEDEMTWTG
jgi:hypothetical protein